MGAVFKSEHLKEMAETIACLGVNVIDGGLYKFRLRISQGAIG